MFDNSKNFAKATVSTGYNNSADVIVLQSGQGALMPTSPFQATWWNSTDYADPSDDPNKEIVRVTNVNGDTLTLANVAGNRTAQEGTSATNKNTAGKVYKIIAGLTAASINNFPAMFVKNEIVRGSGTTFTLANVPVTGSVEVIASRNYLYPSSDAGVDGNDYSISGQTITIYNNSFPAGNVLANYIISTPTI